MSPDQRARALRLADVLDSFYQREVLETASFLRELAAEPVRVPLTEEEITYLILNNGLNCMTREGVRVVERAHGIV